MRRAAAGTDPLLERQYPGRSIAGRKLLVPGRGHRRAGAASRIQSFYIQRAVGARTRPAQAAAVVAPPAPGPAGAGLLLLGIWQGCRSSRRRRS